MSIHGLAVVRYERFLRFYGRERVTQAHGRILVWMRVSHLGALCDLVSSSVFLQFILLTPTFPLRAIVSKGRRESTSTELAARKKTRPSRKADLPFHVVVADAQVRSSEDEYVQSEQIFSEQRVNFTIRYSNTLSNLKTSDRVTYNSEIYQIEGVQEIGRNEGIRLITTLRGE